MIPALLSIFCIQLLLPGPGKAQSPKSILHVTVVDKESGQPTPARVRISFQDGHVAPLPQEAIGVMYGRNDLPEGYTYQPDSSFYVDGSFTMELNRGSYQVWLSKGVEYLDQKFTLELNGEEHNETFALERWIHMADSGWFSGDCHIHIRRSPRENPHLLRWIEAEDIHVGALLQMGDFRNVYFGQFAFGDKGVYKERDRILTPGQEEPRTHQVGHTIQLMADEFIRYQNDYYYYDKLLDRIHELNGFTGYAHQGVLFAAYRGMTLDVLSDRVDFLEILQFCTPGGPLITDHYYHFLDLGYKLTALAGSDFPWCGDRSEYSTDGRPMRIPRIGNVRFYTYLGDDFSYKRWKKKTRAGNTFVSSGPMIDFKVNGHIPGEEIDLKKPSKLTIEVRGYGHRDKVPLSKMEIVVHGQVIASVTPEDQGQSNEAMSIDLQLPVKDGLWIAAVCHAGPGQDAHTTPVYVTVKNGGFENPETYADYLSLNEQYLDELEAELKAPNENLEYRAYWYRKGLKARIDETRLIIDKLKEKK